MAFKKTQSLILFGFPLLFALAVHSCATAEAKENAGAAGEPASADFGGVENREWLLDELIGDSKSVRISRADDIGFGDIFTIKFEDGRLSGMAAPNRYFGAYTAGNGNELSIGKVASTLMASLLEPEELKEYEYFSYLEEVRHWELRSGKLELLITGEDGSEMLMIFFQK